MDAAVPDQGAHGVVQVHDLKGRHQAAAGGVQQLLADDGLEDLGQLDADLLLLGGGEDVDDAVDGVHRPHGVEGGDHQVARLRRRHGGLNGVQIPHLPQQDHVGGLAQAGPEGGDVAGGVHGQLPLADDALLVAVEVLDGVLNGDDVGVAVLVHRVHHAGEGGGLAAPRRAGDQHHAPGHPGDLHNLGRDVLLLPVGDAEAHHADHRRHGAALPVGVHPEAGQALHRQGEVVVPYREVAVNGAAGQAVQLTDQLLRLHNVRHIQLPVLTVSHLHCQIPGGNLAVGMDRHLSDFFLLQIRHEPLQSVVIPGLVQGSHRRHHHQKQDDKDKIRTKTSAVLPQFTSLLFPVPPKGYVTFNNP